MTDKIKCLNHIKEMDMLRININKLKIAITSPETFMIKTIISCFLKTHNKSINLMKL